MNIDINIEVGYLFLIVLVLFFSSKALKFEKITRFGYLIIPIYTLIMGLFSLYHLADFNLLAIILLSLLAIFLGWLETLSAQINVTTKADKFNRPIITLKKGFSFLLGWGFVFLSSLVIHFISLGHFDLSEGLDELETEVSTDLFKFLNFDRESDWYTWLLIALSSLAYLVILTRKEPQIRLALQKKKKAKQRL